MLLLFWHNGNWHDRWTSIFITCPRTLKRRAFLLSKKKKKITENNQNELWSKIVSSVTQSISAFNPIWPFLMRPFGKWIEFNLEDNKLFSEWNVMVEKKKKIQKCTIKMNCSRECYTCAYCTRHTEHQTYCTKNCYSCNQFNWWYQSFLYGMVLWL